MPSPVYMTVVGEKQGAIDGGCTIKGREKTILGQAVDSLVNIPKSPQTGLPTGKRVHNPFSVTAELDKATPKLYQALCSGERMKSVQVDYYRISPTGTEEKYFTIKMENAIVVSMREYVPDCLRPENSTMGHMITYEFTYEKVIWTYVPDGIEGQDDWKAPV